MNKFGKRMVGITLGLALVGGIGFGFFQVEKRCCSTKVDATDTTYTYTITSKNWETSCSQTSSITWSSKTNFVDKNSNGGCVDQNKSASAVSSSAFSSIKSVVLCGKTNASSTGTMEVFYSTTGLDDSYVSLGKKSYNASSSINETYSLPSSMNAYIKIEVTSTTATASKWIYLKTFDIICGESKTPTSITVLDENAEEITEGSEIDVSGKTYTINGEVSYSTGSPDYEFSVTSTESSGISVGTVSSEGDCTISFSNNGSYHITVASKALSSIKVSFVLNVSTIVEEKYVLYTKSTITAGKYILYSDGGAVKNTITSNRLDYSDVTPTDDIITTGDSNIVWTISENDGYWFIYNEETDKYAGSTNSKNQAALIESSSSDNAKWTIAKDSLENTFTFVNYARSISSSDPNNKYLRRNGTNGFATYASGTGTAINLYKTVTAKDWADDFMSKTATACADPTKDNKEAVEEVWSDTSALFNSLNEANKALIKAATHEDVDLGLAVARYDTIISKYDAKSTIISDYVGRVSSSNKDKSVLGSDTTTAIAIVSVVTLVSVSAIGGYFFIKKTKHE